MQSVRQSSRPSLTAASAAAAAAASCYVLDVVSWRLVDPVTRRPISDRRRVMRRVRGPATVRRLLACRLLAIMPTGDMNYLPRIHCIWNDGKVCDIAASATDAAAVAAAALDLCIAPLIL